MYHMSDATIRWHIRDAIFCTPYIIHIRRHRQSVIHHTIRDISYHIVSGSTSIPPRQLLYVFLSQASARVLRHLDSHVLQKHGPK